MTRFDPPPGYDPERRAIWDDTVAQLTEGGRIFRADPRVLDTYVQAAADHADAVRLRTESGARVAIAKDGNVVEHPLLRIQRDAAKALAAASRALGLDRAPITSTPATEPITPPELPGRSCETHQRRECVHDRFGGGPCHGSPVKGTDTCYKHGGKTKEALKADGARNLAARLAPPIEVSPGVGLLQEVHRAAGMVAWLESECAQLPPESLWRGVTKVVDRDGMLETVTESKLHVKLVALNAERDRFASVCDRALARGAEQQIVDAAKAVAGQYVRVVDTILERLELSAEQWARVPTVVPAAFRAITAGPA